MRSFLITVISLSWISLAQAELQPDSSGWRLDFEREGIRIYTKEHDGSDYHAFKAEAILDVPLHDIMGVMAQPGSCVQWVHGCIVSRGVSEGVTSTSFNKRYAYSVNDLPWPVRDRDYVLQINTSNDPATGVVTMHMFAVNDVMPENAEFVRVIDQETHYQFEAVGEDKTRMVWLQHTDPSGYIPSWLVNALIVDIPFNSMRALEAIAKTDQYKGSSLILDEDGSLKGVKAP